MKKLTTFLTAALLSLSPMVAKADEPWSMPIGCEHTTNTTNNWVGTCRMKVDGIHLLIKTSGNKLFVLTDYPHDGECLSNYNPVHINNKPGCLRVEDSRILFGFHVYELHGKEFQLWVVE